MKNKKKTLLMSLAAVLLVVSGVFGTLAYLTDKTDPVVNTFTVGNINIDLTEEAEDFKMVPGNTIEKDPVVTVTDGSENAWVFVKVEESENLREFIEWTIAEGWEKLEDNIYYREYDSAKKGPFNVLAGNRVKVLDTVTKDMMDAIEDEENDAKEPTLTFTAYAVQKDNVDVNQAWEQALIESNYK